MVWPPCIPPRGEHWFLVFSFTVYGRFWKGHVFDMYYLLPPHAEGDSPNSQRSELSAQLGGGIPPACGY